MDPNRIILLCVLAYMALCVAIGLWALKRTRNTSDFFMASRNLGVLITGIALFSSIMSGFGFVGGPGLVYRMGISSFWILVTTPIGFALAFFLVAKRIRLFAELRNSISLPDIAAARYRCPKVRGLVAVAILCGVIAYLATQIRAMAFVLQEIFASNGVWGHDSVVFCVVVSCTVLVFYCVTGGIIASVYTDLFQGIVMVVVAVLIFVGAVGAIEGGMGGMMEVILKDNAEAAGPWGTLGMLGCLSWFFLFTLGVAGQPHVVTKMMMSRKVEDARITLPITLLGYTVTALLWIGIGMLMRSVVLNGGQSELARADDAAAVFLQSYAHPVLAGLVFAGLFAAIMSTADGFLNIGAAAIAHDIPRALTGSAIRRELMWARIATVVLAILAAVFALQSPIQLIGQLGAFGWGVFASALVPVIGLGLNWRGGSRKAALAAIVFSLAANGGLVIAQMAGFSIPYGVSGGALALMGSTLVFVGISLTSKSDSLSPDIEEVMKL
ncbi:sodium:solute symporter family transporter [Candidatus Pelagisphaera phototrophica]|uniref:sodium:solute symporter family transporter n=1 Tax=Candidatus Pelagisphaera phototrophica TaxID=2684113 RepID=UPI0019D91C4C|nr:hypothetical protein [Candidatus Pelagisphaera phototrophica]QXD31356.1 hypothetical protein GA004_13615 [Candidatus Pelagisphaera phototrophica]